VKVSDALGCPEDVRREAELGAMLHDIGKIAIPTEILNKPGRLDPDEWQVMQTHTVEGQRMLNRIGGLLGRVGLIVRASHERWDGRGYPDGLEAEAIPYAARIVCACDAFNAMTTHRPYREAMSPAAAAAELERCSGTQFDPRIVRVVTSVARGG
jgi:HD-GYP domain-containing protein (c-di-GMP phosphodiesterase class II)